MTASLPRYGLRATTAVVVLLGISGCTDVTTNIEPAPNPFDVVFAPVLDIDLTLMNQSITGLLWMDIEVGTGPVVDFGDRVSVGITGWLVDGTQFDSQTVEVLLFAGELIPGLLEGISDMRVGGVRKLVVPPQLAWGTRGNGPVPPNAFVVFEVELFTIIE